MTTDIQVYTYPLPPRIKAYVSLINGFYTIVINETLSPEAKLKAYNHEIEHIARGDCVCDRGVDYMELKIRESGL